MLKKILIYNSGGGLGDAVQLFSLILSLKILAHGIMSNIP